MIFADKMSYFDLSNKTALVTGASGLLGTQHVLALLDSQATVVMTDLNEKTLFKIFNKISNKENNRRLICKVMDVTNEDSILNVSEELTKENINIDILINNAAINPAVDANSIEELTRLENFKIDEWNKQINVGLTGSMLSSKVFGTLMASRNSGVILNIASDLSVIAPDQRLYKVEGLKSRKQPVKPISYSIVKHGIIGLTKYLATYWADSGVRCNALSPGGVYDGQSDDFVKKLTELIPLGRMANKEDYRGAIQFLCSDASNYMNGQNIIMDGGRSIL
jgi:NAD(P)-dependent dehydrogenase (short-subunit alcohol dehydrogenase family)